MPPPARRDESAGVGRGLAGGLANAVTALYRNLERLLLGGIARQIQAPGPSGAGWAAAKLAAISRIQSYAEGLIAALDDQLEDTIEQSVALAWQRGGRAALAELAAASGVSAGDADRLRDELPGVDGVTRLIWSAVTTLRGTHAPILRWALDVYRAAIGAHAPSVLLGTQTRRRAAQVAYEELVSRGVTGFTDRAGRRWELASYVEMAMRSTVAQAAVEGMMDRLREQGIDLVIVSDAPQECKRCRPWEGRVLWRDGAPGPVTITRQHGTSDHRTVQVHVAGTVREAIAAGLMHPNCRHSLSAYLPGVTVIPTNTADPEGDQARQRLRYLERQVRRWKRLQAGALTPEAAAFAGRQVRAYQAKIRDHVADTGMNRQRHREQIGQAR